jgi:hypothetical protein
MSIHPTNFKCEITILTLETFFGIHLVRLVSGTRK